MYMLVHRNIDRQVYSAVFISMHVMCICTCIYCTCQYVYMYMYMYIYVHLSMLMQSLMNIHEVHNIHVQNYPIV